MVVDPKKTFPHKGAFTYFRRLKQLGIDPVWDVFSWAIDGVTPVFGKLGVIDRLVWEPCDFSPTLGRRERIEWDIRDPCVARPLWRFGNMTQTIIIRDRKYYIRSDRLD
jgi:hypothetical protein